VVIGHPSTDSPAYGWVKGLHTQMIDGVKRLLADVELLPEIADWVRKGLYRNRSAAFYGDGRLRHVGFLGGAPPAVKGLAPLPAFADGAHIVFEIRQPKIGGLHMRFSEFVNAINIFKKLGGKDEDIDLIAPPQPPAPAPAAPGKTFTEADIAAATQQAAEQARATALQEAQAQFAETEKQRAAAERKAQIKAFCQDGVAAGKLAPAWVEAGLATFMEQLAAEQTAAIVFCEGAGKKTPAAWFAEFLAGLPELIDFTEVATRDKDMAGADPGGRLDAMVKKRIADNQGMTYSAAFAQVQLENPALAMAYAASINP
jgi:hypothetical protein